MSFVKLQNRWLVLAMAGVLGVAPAVAGTVAWLNWSDDTPAANGQSQFTADAAALVISDAASRGTPGLTYDQASGVLRQSTTRTVIVGQATMSEGYVFDTYGR